MAQDLRCADIHCKNEFQNPSGSHKDRMNPFVIARAMDTKKATISCASSGNEAASLALYAAAAGVECCNVTRILHRYGWRRHLPQKQEWF